MVLLYLNFWVSFKLYSVWWHQKYPVKHFYWIPNLMVCSGNRFMQLFGLQAKLAAFFNGIPFLLEIIAGKVWLYRLGYLAYVFSKKKIACHYKNNWQYLLLMIQSKLSSKNRILKNLYLTLRAWQFSIFDFLIRSLWY